MNIGFKLMILAAPLLVFAYVCGLSLICSGGSFRKARQVGAWGGCVSGFSLFFLGCVALVVTL